MVEFTSDQWFFPAIQLLLVAVVAVAFLMDWGLRRSMGHGISIKVIRSEGSMAKFYAIYGVLTGVFVTIAVAADYAHRHRTFFVLLDVGLVAYLCLFNSWFRSKLIGWTKALAELEKR